MIAIVATAFV